MASCRSLAVEAEANDDFEAFHDLAWAAYRKGRSHDPDLMLLVARAQSLSGRPGDALVMLERIAALGAPTGAATNPDFARVRALPRWPEVEDQFTAETETPPTAPVVEPTPVALPKADPPAVPKTDPPPTAAFPSPKAKEPSGSPAKATTAPPAVKPAPSPEEKPALSPRGAPLKFTTLLTPSALAYDAVSRRFIIADRRARRIAVIDENTGQVATLVGAQGSLGEIGGIAIDPQRGDLWVVTGTDEGAVLHHMQLISGRVLSTVPLSGITEPVVAMAFARGFGLVLSDAAGTIWRTGTNGRADKLAALDYVPRAFAADQAGRLYVSGGAPRLARFALGASLRRLGQISLDPSVPAGAPFAVAGDRLHFIVPVDDGFEVRTFPLK